MKLWKLFLKDKSGQDLIEMALIVSLISVLCIGALTAVQGGIAGTLGAITAAL